MYQELYNDILPLEDIKKAFKDYFLSNTNEIFHNDIAANIEEKLSDSKLAYILLPTNVQNYEMAKYIKDTTEANDSEIRIISQLKQLDSLYQAHYSIIEKNPNVDIPDISSISQFLKLLNIDRNNLIKNNKVDKSSKEYKTLKNWLKDAPIDPSYSPFTKENKTNSYLKAFAEKLENNTGFQINDISNPEVRKSIITLLSTRKELNEYKSIFDMETYLGLIKSLGYISSIPYITFEENLESIIEGNEDLKKFYESLKSFQQEYSSKEKFEITNDIYHQEMLAMILDKLGLNESEENLSSWLDLIDSCSNYFLENNAIAYYSHEAINSNISAIILKIDETFNTSVLVHEMLHALSTHFEQIGYDDNENSTAFNEIVTDYLATELTMSMAQPDGHILSENVSSYKKGIVFLSDILQTFKEEIATDFANPYGTHHLQYSIGTNAYISIIELAKEYLNFNHESLYFKIRYTTDIGVYNENNLLEHLDEIRNSPKYESIKSDLEEYLQFYEKLNSPLIQLPLKRKKLNNLLNTNGDQKVINDLKNEITHLENLQKKQFLPTDSEQRL